MTLKGYPIEGRREDLEDSEIKLFAKHATYTQAGVNKYALDSFQLGAAEVSSGLVVEAGSSSSVIVLTGHAVKKGDLIEFVTTANPINESYAQVWEIINANSFRLAGDLSDELTDGDTFNLLRPTFNRLASDGASLATVVSGPIRFQRGASGVFSPVEVTKDTVDPNNTVPLPVEVVAASGSTINITAGDINVQTSHTGASFDSMRIGDGTNLLGINADNEALVKDADVLAELQILNAAGVATETTLLSVDAELVTLNATDFATDASLQSIDAELVTLNATDFATETTLLAVDNVLDAIAVDAAAIEIVLGSINTKTPSLGQSNEAGSVPVSLTTAQASNLADIDTATTALAAEITVDGIRVSLIEIGDAATEATLAAVSAQLPATLGQKTKANSLAVTLASDSDPIVISEPVVLDFNRVDFASTNVTGAAYVAINTDTGASAFKRVRFFYAGGTPIYLAIGGSTAEVDQMIIPPGADFEIGLTIPANSRVSLKAVTATTISTGQLIINWLG